MTDKYTQTDALTQTDAYTRFVSSGLGRTLAGRLGLPAPVPLRRWSADAPLCESPVLVTGAGAYAPALAGRLSELGVRVLDALPAEDAGMQPGGTDRPASDAVAPERLGALVLDMSSLRDPAELERLRAAGAPAVRRLARNARVVVIGTDPDLLEDPAEVATQRALDGIVRSLGKELRAGATANLVYGPLEADAPARASVVHAVTFFLSGRSAFVDGQHLRIDENPAPATAVTDPTRPLTGKVAVVTGAARGIGAAIVAVLARDGAMVVGVDVPAAGDALATVMNRARGTALAVDVTATDAGARILEHCRSRHGALDIVVHNAGITRDKLFVNLDESRWSSVIDVNLRAVLAMNEAFLGPDGLGGGGRIICLSSQSGLAGNRGQTNYAATKAGLIGMVDALADRVTNRGITVNAVAPGLIETEMTARMPFAMREFARRMNSLQQGGRPVDVAELIAFLAQPASQAITGQTVRVCGQNMIGA